MPDGLCGQGAPAGSRPVRTLVVGTGTEPLRKCRLLPADSWFELS